MKPSRRHPGQGNRQSAQARPTAYRQLRNPFAPQSVFSEDAVAAMHERALRVNETLGIKVLLPEARALYRQAGALVDEETQMVRIGREIIAEALKSCPRSFNGFGGDPRRAVDFTPGSLIFLAGSSCPNVSDLERGRRPGTLGDYIELIKICQHFDVLHLSGNYTEAQDVPVHLRHYAAMRAQLTLSDKMPFVHSRGREQVEDAFAMIRLARGLDERQFRQAVYAHTVINSNSPRVLDNSMAQGLIDFARNGQVTIVTPFCLAGAMAPITIAGALTLQHAEALAGITLAQLAHPGAPVLYGSFLSNVDMKSGSPAFGTPTPSAGDPRSRAARPPGGPAVARRRRHRGQRGRCPGGLGDPVLAVGERARRRDPVHPRGGLDGRRTDAFLREADRGHRGAADARGTVRGAAGR